MSNLPWRRDTVGVLTGPKLHKFFVALVSSCVSNVAIKMKFSVDKVYSIVV